MFTHKYRPMYMHANECWRCAGHTVRSLVGVWYTFAEPQPSARWQNTLRLPLSGGLWGVGGAGRVSRQGPISECTG